MSDNFTTGPQRPTANPTTEHEEFIRMLRDMIDQSVSSRLPTMGTVKGSDGGKVIVQVDDEEDARQLGFPRKLGTCYNVDDRVLLVPNRSGEYMVAGVISTAQGSDAARVTDSDIIDVSGGKVVQNSLDGSSLKANTVDTNKIANNAIKSDQIAENALLTKHLPSGNNASNFQVGKKNIANNAIDSTHLEKGSVKGGKDAQSTGALAEKTVDTYNIADKAITADKLASGAVTLGSKAVKSSNIDDSAVGTNQLANKAVTKDKVEDNIDLSGKLKDKTIGYKKLNDDVLTELKKIFVEKPR